MVEQKADKTEKPSEEIKLSMDMEKDELLAAA